MSKDSGHLGGFPGFIHQRGRIRIGSWEIYIPATSLLTENFSLEAWPTSYAEGVVLTGTVISTDADILTTSDWQLGISIAAGNGTEPYSGLPIPHDQDAANWAAGTLFDSGQQFRTGAYYMEYWPEGDANFGGPWNGAEFFKPYLITSANFASDLTVLVEVYANISQWGDRRNPYFKTRPGVWRNFEARSVKRDDIFELKPKPTGVVDPK